MHLAGLPVKGGVSERLWDECQVEAFQCLQHPFVVALAAGTLPRECFRQYVAQDSFFLQNFAAAYAAAIAKATADEKAVTAMVDTISTSLRPAQVLQQLLDSVSEELQLHENYAAKWAITPAELTNPNPATKAYTNFLTHVADDSKTTVAEVLAAMVPCSRLYGFLGSSLVTAWSSDQPRHTYSDWLDTYSSQEYLEYPDIKEKLLDHLSYQAPYDRLKELYRRAMQLEVEFFSAQPSMPPSRRVGMLVVDFDDTCTQGDTVGTLLAAAVEARRKTSGAAAADALHAQVQSLAAAYARKQQVVVAQELTRTGGAAAAAAAGAGPGVEFDGEQLTNYLAKLSDFDTEANSLVVESGVLAGMTKEDILAAAGKVQLRPGCKETLAAAAAAGVALHVLSVNWSSSFVARALCLPYRIAQLPDSPATPSHHDLVIHANELVFGPQGTTTGEILRNVENARDKGLLFEDLLLSEASEASMHRARSVTDLNGGSGTEQAAAGGAERGQGDGPDGCNTSTSSSSRERPCTVYVGDSVSDVLPLLEADYGIIISNNSSIRRVLQEFGVQLLPLCRAPLTPPASAEHPPVLYEANSWTEVQAFILGPPPVDGLGKGLSSSSSKSGLGAEAAAGPKGLGNGSMAQQQQQQQQRRHWQEQQQLKRLPRVLTVAGSDSGGGAGIQADLKSILANGAFGMTAITAITAQNTQGVQGVQGVPPDMLAGQLDSVLGDLGTDVVKTGMLPDEDTVKLVASKLKQYGVSLVVVDPVMISTSGHSLAAGGVAAAMQEHLFPLATLITPNLVEASVLLGGMPIHSVAAMQAAAQKLHALGPRYVLVKGGHLVEEQQQQKQQQGGPAVGAAPCTNGSSSSSSGEGGAGQSGDLRAVDVLFDGRICWTLTSPAVSTGNLHGTGCTLASAIAAGLARGLCMVDAVRGAKAYLTSALAGSVQLAMGGGPQRPFNHGVGLIQEVQLEQCGQELVELTPISTSAAAPGAAAVAAAAAGAPQRVAQEAAREQQVLRSREVNPCDLRVYVVTDPGCNERMGRSMVEAVRGAVAGGATLVQLREKDIDGGDFLKMAREVVQLCQPLGIPVIINDRVDVALAAEADGVHVGQSDIPAADVRHLIGPGRILGVSVDTPAQALQAVCDGADYLGCGAVYPTGTKEAEVLGLEGFQRVCQAVDVPVVSIGGVAASNAAETIAVGAAGVAVVSAVFGAPNVEGATAELRQVVEAALMQARQEQGSAEQQELEDELRLLAAIG